MKTRVKIEVKFRALLTSAPDWGGWKVLRLDGPTAGVYIYIYMCVCVCVCVCINTHICTGLRRLRIFVTGHTHTHTPAVGPFSLKYSQSPLPSADVNKCAELYLYFYMRLHLKMSKLMVQVTRLICTSRQPIESWPRYYIYIYIH